MTERSILVNGLCIRSGGVYTVGRELMIHLAKLRPDWRFTIALITGYRLHQQMKNESFPENCDFIWAPPSAEGIIHRRRFENKQLVDWTEANRVDAVLQLNGMVVPKMRVPTLAHFQDPWPYRSIAWRRPVRDRINAVLKRNEHGRSLRQASYCTFTSNYLRDLICGHWKFTPARSEICYNGVQDSWIERASAGFNDWSARPMEIVTVSNVRPYKRQHLVVEALACLVREHGLKQLRYRMIGDCPPSTRRALEKLANLLGVQDRISIEGRVPDAEVVRALETARCCALMSVCESFGIPAIEAMSFGTPVVTADCLAIPEVCGEAAERCPVDDVQGLTERLLTVLTDDGRAGQLRRAGQERVKHFRWQQSAEQMLGCLKEIISDEPHRTKLCAA